jgi:hypothetical protein
VIPTMQGSTNRIVVQAGPGQPRHKVRPYHKNNQSRTDSVAQAIDCLLSKHKALPKFKTLVLPKINNQSTKVWLEWLK